MEAIRFREIGTVLSSAFHLHARPLAIYGADCPPEGAVHLARVNRCFAVTLFSMATGNAPDTIYATGDEPEGCCPGGLSHTGLMRRPGFIRYFVSTGREGVMGGAAEYLKASPELVDRCHEALGQVTPPGNCLVVQACSALPEPEPAVRAICCFGDAEQIRNLAALVHFDRDDPFSPVIVPWGPACATYISYPAGLAEKAPGQAAFMGPQDPTQNHSLPPDMMALGIPARIAVRMARNLADSFAVKRPGVAFPPHG